MKHPCILEIIMEASGEKNWKWELAMFLNFSLFGTERIILLSY